MDLTAHLPADDRERVEARLREPAYLAKYTERIGTLFDTPERFAELFAAAVIITPTKLYA